MRYRSLGLATVLIVTSTAWAQTPSDNQHALIGPPQLHALPVTAPTLVEAYGPDPLQIGELRLPAGPGPFPVVMVIHGGCWTKGYETLAGTAPLASALTDKGVATWNIEYRQVGDTRGGWPGTFQDWGAALDHLRVLARTQPLDLKHVVTVGHSAGAHAALWLAARPRLARRRTPSSARSSFTAPAGYATMGYRLKDTERPRSIWWLEPLSSGTRPTSRRCFAIWSSKERKSRPNFSNICHRWAGNTSI
ncbi:alpha/beta hydrolase [Sphingomonas sp. ABOLH]|nr:alpha/beta hydrolase [Sphingomonas sp. ABOLH]